MFNLLLIILIVLDVVIIYKLTSYLVQLNFLRHILYILGLLIFVGPIIKHLFLALLGEKYGFSFYFSLIWLLLSLVSLLVILFYTKYKYVPGLKDGYVVDKLQQVDYLTKDHNLENQMLKKIHKFNANEPIVRRTKQLVKPTYEINKIDEQQILMKAKVLPQAIYKTPDLTIVAKRNFIETSKDTLKQLFHLKK